MNRPKIAKHTLGEGKFARLVAEDGWEWIERTRAAGAVVIFAATAAREVVLIEQYRIPIKQRLIEPPAGIVGDSLETRGEELLTAARRELLEETGFESDDWHLLCEGPSTAGLADEVYTLFLARNARRVAEGGGDDGEEITVHVVPLDGIEAWLAHRRAEGLAIDPKIYAGLYFLRSSEAASRDCAARRSDRRGGTTPPSRGDAENDHSAAH